MYANIGNSFSSIPPVEAEFVYFVYNLKHNTMNVDTGFLLQRRTIRKYTAKMSAMIC